MGKILIVALLFLVAVGLVWWMGHPVPPRWLLGRHPKAREAVGNLRAGRRESKRILNEAHTEVSMAKQRLADNLRLCDERLDALQRERGANRKKADDCGNPVGKPLWPLQLREHALLIFSQDEAAEAATLPEQEPQRKVVQTLALEGLHVVLDARSLQHVICVRVTPAGGREQSIPFRRTLENEVAADAFVVAVRGQIQEDQAFRENLRSTDARLIAEIEQAAADRTRLEESGGNDVAAAERKLTAAVSRASTVKAKAYANWQKTTGRRPFW
ncbi:hypothetical protein PO587_38785 [Streptomyces gilvifuscus]|uniref:Uncharacterized protein n=1 Tax=Streptomyces gilvifuscus TaxID=1550617 RepID=A0ABT5G6G6_9ACTN|nr:hypothetical protein [Streptomyces gilvifuscus]MDC2960389.1 hypothetical protein [Streptomyces gilvifuscus]